MLKLSDEGRGADALQEAKSWQFVPAATDQAVALGLSDSPQGVDRLAGITSANDPFPEELDDLARRLSARTREFNDRGEFSITHDNLLERRQERHADLEAKLVAAIRRGAIWESLRLELERDFDALVGDFGHLLDRMDAAAMKGRL